MALERWKRIQLARHSFLPTDARDLLETYGDVPLPLSREKLSEENKFSPEAREALAKKGFLIYSLKGKSIKQLINEGEQFVSSWHQTYPDFEEKTTEVREVAIDPNKPFLWDSSGRTIGRQEAMIREYSGDLSRQIGGVMAVIGEAPEYAEVAFAHLKATQERLFGKKNGFNYARTKTLFGYDFQGKEGYATSKFAVVGCFGEDGLMIDDEPSRLEHSYVAPLIVPA